MYQNSPKITNEDLSARQISELQTYLFQFKDVLNDIANIDNPNHIHKPYKLAIIQVYLLGIFSTTIEPSRFDTEQNKINRDNINNFIYLLQAFDIEFQKTKYENNSLKEQAVSIIHIIDDLYQTHKEECGVTWKTNLDGEKMLLRLLSNCDRRLGGDMSLGISYGRRAGDIISNPYVTNPTVNSFVQAEKSLN